MGLRAFIAAFSVALAAPVIVSASAVAKCGDVSWLSGPGLSSPGVRLPCTTTSLGKHLPRKSGVSVLQEVPSRHGPRYTITYPFTTQMGSPRRWLIRLFPYAVGGPVVHVPAGHNVFNLFVTKSFTFRVHGSIARAFRVLYFPGRAARLVPPASQIPSTRNAAAPAAHPLVVIAGGWS
jgi:hypothetical protein